MRTPKATTIATPNAIEAGTSSASGLDRCRFPRLAAKGRGRTYSVRRSTRLRTASTSRTKVVARENSAAFPEEFPAIDCAFVLARDLSADGITGGREAKQERIER
jgi:hypothetical protein